MPIRHDPIREGSADSPDHYADARHHAQRADARGQGRWADALGQDVHEHEQDYSASSHHDADAQEPASDQTPYDDPPDDQAPGDNDGDDKDGGAKPRTNTPNDTKDGGTKRGNAEFRDGNHRQDKHPGDKHDGDKQNGDKQNPRSRIPKRRTIDSAKLAGRASAEAAVAAVDEQRDAPADGSPTTPPDLTAAAFFDVDNTMMMGASLFHFARGLAARKFLTASDLAGFAWQQIKFRVGGREDPHDVASSSEQALSFVAGRKVRELVELSEEIYDELMADRIWAGTRALAQRHLETGQRVWLVTATPVELAQIIARRLGLTGALGTVAENTRGVYTGKLVGEMLHGRAKAHAVRALAASEGLDLRRCTAYSDSSNDVPMLSAVGTAVAVNPDQRLRDVARARAWQICDFRTGRKAARIGMRSMLGAGAVAGVLAAGRAYRRRDGLSSPRSS